MAVDSGWLLCRWTLHLQMSWPDDALPLRFAYVSSIRWQDYLKKVLASRYLRSPFEEQRPLFSRFSLSKTLALSAWFVGIASVVRQHTHVRPWRRKTNPSQCDAEEIDIYLQQEEGPLVLSSRCNSRWHSPPKSYGFRTLAFAGHHMGQAGLRGSAGTRRFEVLNVIQARNCLNLPMFSGWRSDCYSFWLP